ncbi:hypothetical protein BLNAU_7092 [Blattamonas nauphoetae]|uniref:Uncharacterized protein n=1 Tax=Blattamonas nauphoetae TaxID=2049346 RepID=A0ABQ9Y2F1_9EUKA|nr:hypothetical protein BLNAU_7092 [Blattamonas nauphoetae]
MKLLNNLLADCSTQNHLALIKAGLISELIITLNPSSLSFTEAEDIHLYLLTIVWNSIWFATPTGLEHLNFEDDDEQQTVRETVLKQVVAPSEKYISHLCVNYFSIIDGMQPMYFMVLLVRLVQLCSYYQPSMDIVVVMPIVLTIPSCLTFFAFNDSIWNFLFYMNACQWERNRERGAERQMWKTMHGMLRMEGIEDVIEEELQTDKDTIAGRKIVAESVNLNNLQGMNLPKPWWIQA